MSFKGFFDISPVGRIGRIGRISAEKDGADGVGQVGRFFPRKRFLYREARVDQTGWANWADWRGVGRVRRSRTSRTVFPPEALSISRGESGSDRLAELGGLGAVGRGRGAIFFRRLLYIAKRCPYKWAASSGGRTGRTGSFFRGLLLHRKAMSVQVGGEFRGRTGPTFRTSRTGSGDGSDWGRGVFQNVKVLFAMIASEIKLVKLD